MMKSNDYLLHLIIMTEKDTVITMAEEMQNYFLGRYLLEAFMIVKSRMKKPKFTSGRNHGITP